jgi:hypothetical protein
MGAKDACWKQNAKSQGAETGHIIVGIPFFGLPSFPLTTPTLCIVEFWSPHFLIALWKMAHILGAGGGQVSEIPSSLWNSPRVRRLCPFRSLFPISCSRHPCHVRTMETEQRRGLRWQGKCCPAWSCCAGRNVKSPAVFECQSHGTERENSILHAFNLKGCFFVSKCGKVELQIPRTYCPSLQPYPHSYSNGVQTGRNTVINENLKGSKWEGILAEKNREVLSEWWLSGWAFESTEELPSCKPSFLKKLLTIWGDRLYLTYPQTHTPLAMTTSLGFALLSFNKPRRNLTGWELEDRSSENSISH